MTIPKLISIADNLANPSDADALQSAIYQLQKENLDFKAKYQECFAKLQELQNWEMTKKDYKEYKTSGGSIVQISIKESTPEILYCPVCFAKKFIIPLQAVPYNIAIKSKASPEGRTIREALDIAAKKYPEEALQYNDDNIDDIHAHYDYLLKHEIIKNRISKSYFCL